MAEAIAAVGLVASIASLVDLSARLVSRIRDFTSTSADVPDSFRSLQTRLPLLMATLQDIRSQAPVQAKIGNVPEDTVKALKAVIDDTSEHVSTISICLSKVLPSDSVSRLERALKALKSLAKEDQVQQALQKIHENNESLILYQTTRSIGKADRITEELSKLKIARPASSKSFGICLGRSPPIAAGAFIGRSNELQQLHDWLSPKSQPSRQRTLAIAGMGGVGKTQLSLAYVREYAEDYSSVFWMNAMDEMSLRRSMADLCTVVCYDSGHLAARNADDEELKVNRFRHWLSETGNDQWLLIFDNYDNPCLPGMRNSPGYDVRAYFPHREQGSILITTRSPQLLYAKQLSLKKLEDLEQSLAILGARSGRTVEGDGSAERLAQRLDGLPLALATAGSYLSQSADSFSDYLQLYNDSWTDLSEYSCGPIDYEERTLYSTWNVSFQQVEHQDYAAAELLKLTAYLDHQNLWYELFHQELSDAPEWWTQLQKSRVRFNRAISTLHNYSLLEVNGGQYSLHTCEHDWIWEHLNRGFDQEKCRIAVHCVAASVGESSEVNRWMHSRRLLAHAYRFEHVRLKEVIDWNAVESEDLERLALLYMDNDRYAEAEKMFQLALDGGERLWGPGRARTYDLLNNLALIYLDQNKLDKGEETFQRALDGKEKKWGPNHPSTLATLSNLALLHVEQGKLAEAEQMYRRVINGNQQIRGFDHPSTLSAVNNLAILYTKQGKLAEAEQMHRQVLGVREKVLGLNHPTTLATIGSLGSLDQKQGRLAEAEQKYRQVLDEFKRTCPDHILALGTCDDLGKLYEDQGRLDEAEDTFVWLLSTKERKWGNHYNSTLDTVCDLAKVHVKQGRADLAEREFRRALDGYKQELGPDHATTLRAAKALDNLTRFGEPFPAGPEDSNQEPAARPFKEGDIAR